VSLPVQGSIVGPGSDRGWTVLIKYIYFY
jgi:hypothetical protein